jgi:hypothetical protein
MFGMGIFCVFLGSV